MGTGIYIQELFRSLQKVDNRNRYVTLNIQNRLPRKNLVTKMGNALMDLFYMHCWVPGSAFGEQQAPNGVADSVPSWTRDDSTVVDLLVLNIAFYKRPDADTIWLTGQKTNDHATQDAEIILTVGGQSATETVTALAANVDFARDLDISALGDNAIYEILVHLNWPVSAAGAATLTLALAQLWNGPTGASPT